MTQQITVDNQDLIHMIKGTGGVPRSLWDTNLKHLGVLTGYPNEHWWWNESVLKSMHTVELWNVYQAIKKEL